MISQRAPQGSIKNSFPRKFLQRLETLELPPRAAFLYRTVGTAAAGSGWQGYKKGSLEKGASSQESSGISRAEREKNEWKNTEFSPPRRKARNPWVQLVGSGSSVWEDNIEFSEMTLVLYNTCARFPIGNL